MPASVVNESAELIEVHRQVFASHDVLGLQSNDASTVMFDRRQSLDLNVPAIWLDLQRASAPALDGDWLRRILDQEPWQSIELPVDKGPA
jgi:hypothetical protein